MTRTVVFDEEQIARYAPLVKQIALRYAFGLPPGLDLDDLIAYGSYGLLAAAQRYDPERGVPFAAFAAQRIRGAILDGLRAFQPLPEPARRDLKRLGEVRERLLVELGREPSTEEAAAALGKTPAEVEDLERMAAMLSAVSLEEALFGGIPDASSPEDDVLAADRRQRLAEALSALTANERRVLELVYYHDLNLSECAAVMGVTPSRCSQLHRRAILRLRTLLSAEEMEC